MDFKLLVGMYYCKVYISPAINTYIPQDIVLVSLMIKIYFEFLEPEFETWEITIVFMFPSACPGFSSEWEEKTECIFFFLKYVVHSLIACTFIIL